MANGLDECFERIRQAALPGMEEAGNDAPEAARQKPATPVTVKEIVQEKFEVITILNKWLINAKGAQAERSRRILRKDYQVHQQGLRLVSAAKIKGDRLWQ